MRRCCQASSCVGLQPRPRERVELGAQVLRREVGEVEERVPRELAPAELRQEPAAAARGDGLVPDGVRAQLAPAQARREQRRRAGRRLVARAAVAREVVVEELPQPRAGGRLARLPRLAQSAGPVRMPRQQVPVLERVAEIGRSAARRSRAARAAGARGGRPQARAPERREHREVRARARRHRPRLEQQRRRERRDLDAVRPQRGLELGVDLALRRRRSAGSRRRRRPRHPSPPRAPRDPPVRAAAPAARPLVAAARPSDASEWCSHQRAAPPSGRMPGDSSSSTYSTMTGSPRSSAARSAGLSARRRSSRNHTMLGLTIPSSCHRPRDMRPRH